MNESSRTSPTLGPNKEPAGSGVSGSPHVERSLGLRKPRYGADSIDATGIHFLKRSIRAVSKWLPAWCRFFWLGLPEMTSWQPPTEGSFNVVPNGIASGIGANFTAGGRYIASLTLGSGEFIDSRFLRKQRCFPRIKQAGGPILSLVGEGQSNYYRWLTETLPRLRFIEQNATDGAAVYACQSRPFHRESLAALLPPRTEIIASNQTPYLQSPRLLVPPFVGEDEPWIIPWLRERVPATAAPPAASAPRRLYISRQRAHGRRIANEDALVSLLGEFGFTTVMAEEMSWSSQMALFCNAEMVVGAHGAGLANLVFCTDTRVIEFIADSYPYTAYPRISRELGLRHECLSSEPVDPQRVHSSDLIVPLAELRAILRD